MLFQGTRNSVSRLFANKRLSITHTPGKCYFTSKTAVFGFVSFSQRHEWSISLQRLLRSVLTLSSKQDFLTVTHLTTIGELVTVTTLALVTVVQVDADLRAVAVLARQALVHNCAQNPSSGDETKTGRRRTCKALIAAQLLRDPGFENTGIWRDRDREEEAVGWRVPFFNENRCWI